MSKYFVIEVILCIILNLLRNSNSSLTAIGTKIEGDDIVFQKHYETEITKKLENHTINVVIPENKIVTYVKFFPSTHLTTSVISFEGDNVKNVQFTAYNTTKFTLNVTIYGFEQQKQKKPRFYELLLKLDEQEKNLNENYKIINNDINDDSENDSYVFDPFDDNQSNEDFNEFDHDLLYRQYLKMHNYPMNTQTKVEINSQNIDNIVNSNEEEEENETIIESHDEIEKLEFSILALVEQAIKDMQSTSSSSSSQINLNIIIYYLCIIFTYALIY